MAFTMIDALGRSSAAARRRSESAASCLDAQSIETRVPSENFSHRVSDHNCPHAHRRHAHEQVDDFFFVVSEAVGVELFAEGRVFGFLFFVLVENCRRDCSWTLGTATNCRTVANLGLRTRAHKD